MTRFASKLTAFTSASRISNAYHKSFVVPTIRSDFGLCGVWNSLKKGSNASALDYLFVRDINNTISLQTLSGG